MCVCGCNAGRTGTERERQRGKWLKIGLKEVTVSVFAYVTTMMITATICFSVFCEKNICHERSRRRVCICY